MTVRSRLPLIISLAAVLLLALALRVGFAALVVVQHDSASFTDIHGDTAGYVRIGERIYDRREYTAGGGMHRNRGLIRPPGYPAFYAVVRRAYDFVGIDLKSDLRPIVWPQVLISTLGVAATYGIALVALRSVTAATIAGTLAAWSPTGVAAAAIAMPDSTFAVCFAFSFLGFLTALPCSPSRVLTGEGRGAGPSGRARGSSSEPSSTMPLTPAPSPEYNRDATRKHSVATSLAGLALALAALLKPAAIYWPLVAVPALLLARGLNRAALADVRRLVLPLAIVVVTWTAFNATFNDLPVYSIVSARNLRYGVAPKVELLVKLHRMPTQAEYVRYAAIAADRDDVFIRADNASPAELYHRITAETRAIFIAHPTETARVLASNLWSQLTSRYKVIRKQLPRAGMWPANPIRVLVDWTDSPLALSLWYGPMLLALPLAWWAQRRVDRARSPTTNAGTKLWRPMLRPLVLCWLGFAYIALPTASVADEGSRLILAGEPMALTLIVAAIMSVLQWPPDYQCRLA